MKALLKWSAIGIALLVGCVVFKLNYQKRYVPPENVTEVAALLSWMGEPWWVNRYSDGSKQYYEIGKKEPVWILMATLSSSSPSYTIDEDGRLIGWSPDSGDIRRPELIRELSDSRLEVPVDEFLAAFNHNSEDGAGNP
jgi:hypothetical protein